jgi:hypothetical protein
MIASTSLVVSWLNWIYNSRRKPVRKGWQLDRIIINVSELFVIYLFEKTTG